MGFLTFFFFLSFEWVFVHIFKFCSLVQKDTVAVVHTKISISVFCRSFFLYIFLVIILYSCRMVNSFFVNIILIISHYFMQLITINNTPQLTFSNGGYSGRKQQERRHTTAYRKLYNMHVFFIEYWSRHWRGKCLTLFKILVTFMTEVDACPLIV